MITVNSILQDAVIDDINKAENGDVSHGRLNRLFKRSQLRIHDYLTGRITNDKPPFAFENQKNRDLLEQFITPYQKTVINGKIEKPKDYYSFVSLSTIGGYEESECEAEDTKIDDTDYPIDLLTHPQFDSRATTWIKSLKPSVKKPIAKMYNNTFEFLPKDLGDVKLFYIRLPKFAEIKTIQDTVFNKPIVDEVNSINFEYGEEFREMLIWFIVDTFQLHTREQALRVNNNNKKEGL